MAIVTLVLSRQPDVRLWWARARWVLERANHDLEIVWSLEAVDDELVYQFSDPRRPDLTQRFVCWSADDEVLLRRIGSPCEMVTEEDWIELQAQRSVCVVVELRNNWSLRCLAKLRHEQVRHPDRFGIVAILDPNFGLDITFLDALLDISPDTDLNHRPVIVRSDTGAFGDCGWVSHFVDRYRAGG